MIVEKIFIGGWFQRTTLHLSEAFDFLRYGKSQLNLDAEKLKEYHRGLGLTDVKYKIDGMEVLELKTEAKISISIFEDGLITLSADEPVEVTPETLNKNLEFLSEYYEKRFSPALSYLFSLGAPVPKELANIKTVYPYFFVFDDASREEIREFLGMIETEKYLEIEGDGYELFRGDRYYIVNRRGISLDTTKSFIEEQIFLKEFKAQLHRYLNIHRIVWKKIDLVKEKKQIKGRDVAKVRGQVESYAKTINLIEARMSQMGTYLATREKIAHKDSRLAPFLKTLEYRYEAMTDTLNYSENLWHMTKNHVESALTLLSELHQEATNSSIENLTMVMVIGVGASIIQVLEMETVPNMVGYIALVAMVIFGFIGVKVIRWRAENTAYDYSGVDYDTKIE
ncbi:hypothetical protein FWD07_03100 [Candidatus Saccharibacteria bacterium]|nr:hypothetical protein [Candidatus Saccharibacteria bacterium]